MAVKVTQRAFEDTTIAIFMRKQIDTLKDIGIDQREIALQAGYEKPNVLSMFKRGETKVPLNKVIPLAKALRVDPHFLFRLAVQQPDMPITTEDVNKLFPNTVSAGELKVIEAIRAVAEGDVNPTEDQVKQIAEVFKKKRAISPVPNSL